MVSSAPQLLQQALTYHRAGDIGAAAQLYQQIIAADPHHADAYQLLGVIAQQMGRGALARELLETALQHQPRHAPALANLALLLRATGDLAGAQQRAAAAVAADPQLAEGHIALGGLLAVQRDYPAALKHYRQALAKQPENTALLNDIATAERRQRDFAAAYTTITRALALQPTNAMLHNTRGNILRAAGYPDLAIAAFEAAYQHDPSLSEAQHNAALCHLLLGDFTQGWPLYATRGKPDERTETLQPWDGKTAAALLIRAEQGLGDTLQFVRYVASAKEVADGIVLEVQRPLQALLQHNYSDLTIITPDDSLPESLTHHCRLLDLPPWFAAPNAAPYLVAPSIESVRVLHGESAVIPTKAGIQPLTRGNAEEKPYIAADAALGLDSGLRRNDVLTTQNSSQEEQISPHIGLVWAGNPAHLNDANRSLTLTQLAPILRPYQSHIISLQKGSPAAELTKSDLTPIDGSAGLEDFASTAVLVQSLALVITVDTSVAHLAGALGKPVWLLLPYDPDWRWLLQRCDTPWYPTMKLYRQQQPMDWSHPLQQLGEDLARFIAGDQTVLTPPVWSGTTAQRPESSVPLDGIV